jgi:hypothetical protein
MIVIGAVILFALFALVGTHG